MQTHGWVYNAVHSHVSDMVSKILHHFSLEMRPGLPLTPSRYRAIAVRETSIREFIWIRLYKDTFLNPRLTFSYNNGVLSQLEEWLPPSLSPSPTAGRVWVYYPIPVSLRGYDSPRYDRLLTHSLQAGQHGTRH